MQKIVIDKASRKVINVCKHCESVILPVIPSKIADKTAKIVSGAKKATVALETTKAALFLPNWQ